MQLKVAAQLIGLAMTALGKWRVAVGTCQIAEAHEHVVQEKSQPHAFALALHADQIHPVVPVAGTHQRQAVFAKA